MKLIMYTYWIWFTSPSNPNTTNTAELNFWNFIMPRQGQIPLNLAYAQFAVAF